MKKQYHIRQITKPNTKQEKKDATNKNCYHATKTKLTRKKGNKANINNNKRKCNI